ncbi:hypothetical protein N0A02_00815 [Paraburkholderia acidicola]|uniref:Uncharacterized protein n=1 Tax=Paraburkholderia acidicola TaxID=1912599 RepID=A0ABV1LF85_9BURK
MQDTMLEAELSRVEEETLNLETIRMRNQRFTNNPLSAHFFDDLFAPVMASEVFAFRADWHCAVVDLADIIDRALSQHWDAIEGPCRTAYNWRSGSVESREDYPVWAHRAATNLMYRGDSAFQHGGDGDAESDDLLTMARWLSGAHDQITDAQLLSCLAIREATGAARHLIKTVGHVERESSVAHWLRAYRKPDVQADPVAQLLFEPEVEAAINAAALSLFYPELPYITECRIHAEKLLLLADISATGGLSGSAAGRLLSTMQENRERAREAESALEAVREKKMRGPLKGAEVRRKLSEPEKVRLRKEADQLRQTRPTAQEKEIEFALADSWGTSRSTIQRALGKKK